MGSRFISELHRSISKDLFEVLLSSVRIIITLINLHIFLVLHNYQETRTLYNRLLLLASNQTFFLNVSRFPRILDDKERFIANYELFT